MLVNVQDLFCLQRIVNFWLYSGDGLKDDKQGEVYGEQYWLIIKVNKFWV